MVDMPLNPTKPNHIYLIYMYKEDLSLNNLQCQRYEAPSENQTH